MLENYFIFCIEIVYKIQLIVDLVAAKCLFSAKPPRLQILTYCR